MEGILLLLLILLITVLWKAVVDFISLAERADRMVKEARREYWGIRVFENISNTQVLLGQRKRKKTQKKEEE